MIYVYFQKIEILVVVYSLLQDTRTMFEVKLQTTPGIYIPHLFLNITPENLTQIIRELNVFKESQLDFNQKENSITGKKYYSVFIHIAEWFTNPTAQRMRQKLLNNEDVKVVFNNPWYFICKRKHELHELQQPDNIHENEAHITNIIAPVPRNVKGVNRTPSPCN